MEQPTSVGTGGGPAGELGAYPMWRVRQPIQKTAPSSLSLFPTRDPDILDVQATAQMLGISTRAVYALFKKGELPGRKVARRWLTTGDLVIGWLKGASEQDTLARANLKHQK